MPAATSAIQLRRARRPAVSRPSPSSAAQIREKAKNMATRAGERTLAKPGSSMSSA
jgi:hypothetical protein